MSTPPKATERSLSGPTIACLTMTVLWTVVTGWLVNSVPENADPDRLLAAIAVLLTFVNAWIIAALHHYRKDQSS